MPKLTQLTLRQCWYMLACFAISLICVGGASVYPIHIRYYALVAVSVGSVVITMISKKSISFNWFNASWLIVSVLIIISSLTSYSPKETLHFGIVYLCATLILFVDFPHTFWRYLINLMNVFVIVVAVSIIASAFIDNFMLRFFGFIMNPRNNAAVIAQIKDELRIGAYSGFAGEKAEAAYIMNIGVAIVLSKFFTGTKRKLANVIELAMCLVALVLTGKRMLFVIPIIAFVVMLFFSDIKFKFTKFLFVGVLGVAALLMMSAMIPQMNVLYERFVGNVGSQDYDMLTGRGTLWRYSFMMFGDNPILGVGYGSYNDYMFDKGFLFKGEHWRYYGHNCYYEALGEIGIVGAVAVFALFIAVFVVTIRLIKRGDISQFYKQMLMFSLYVQTLMFTYCATANVLYNEDQLFMWFVAAAMTFSVYKQSKPQEKKKKIGGYIHAKNRNLNLS